MVANHETAVTFDRSGVGRATTRIDFDFKDDKGRGPYLFFVSRYLPWAAAFGVADRWTKLFSELAAQCGYAMPDGGWYIGHDYGFAPLNSFDHSIEQSMQSAANAASSSSGSDSGFSGGGGGGGGW